MFPLVSPTPPGVARTVKPSPRSAAPEVPETLPEASPGGPVPKQVMAHLLVLEQRIANQNATLGLLNGQVAAYASENMELRRDLEALRATVPDLQGRERELSQLRQEVWSHASEASHREGERNKVISALSTEVNLLRRGEGR